MDLRGVFDACVRDFLPSRGPSDAVNFYLYCITGSLFRQELCALFGCRSSVRQHHGRLTRPPSRRGTTTTATRRHNAAAADIELDNIVS